jgi:hypothetical protein
MATLDKSLSESAWLDQTLGQCLAAALQGDSKTEGSPPLEGAMVSVPEVDALMDAARRARVQVLVLQGLEKLRQAGKANEGPPDSAHQKREALFRAMLIERDRARVGEALTSAGIPHLFFKGALTDALFFGGLGRRDCTDVDVLVNTDQKEKALAILSLLGWEKVAFEKRRASKARSPGRECKWTGEGLGVDVDLHHGLTKAPYVDPAEAILSRRRLYELGREKIWGPTPEDMLVVAAVNLASSKFVDSRWRQAVDAWGVLNQFELDWTLLAERIANTGAQWALWGLLRLVRARLPRPEKSPAPPAAFFERIAPPIFQQLLVEWAVGIKRRPHIPESPAGRLLLEWPLSNKGTWPLKALATRARLKVLDVGMRP